MKTSKENSGFSVAVPFTGSNMLGLGALGPNHCFVEIGCLGLQVSRARFVGDMPGAQQKYIRLRDSICPQWSLYGRIQQLLANDIANKLAEFSRLQSRLPELTILDRDSFTRQGNINVIQQSRI